MLVSVIIPVYNVKDFLEKSVNSILSQSYSDLEVILVDDGSTDGSSKLCDNFATKDHRVKVIHKSNGGASSARNLGVQQSLGEYILFVDGDDFWKDENQLKILMTNTKTDDYDFVAFNYQKYYSLSDLYVESTHFDSNILSLEDSKSLIINLCESGLFPACPWLYLLKRKFILDNNLFFPTGTTGEDIPWFISILLKANRIRFVDQYMYVYRQRAGSVSNNFSYKNFNDLFLIIKQLYSQISHQILDNNVKAALFSFVAYEYCILLGMLPSTTLSCSYKQDVFNYSFLLKYRKNPKVRMVYNVQAFIGTRLTSYLLNLFLKKKKKTQ